VTGNVNIKLSTDGGTSFPITLAANTANDGNESVTVPNNPSTTCRVRVESVANPNVVGVNPGNFTIQAPTVALNPPRNLTAAAAGNTVTLNWQPPATVALSAQAMVASNETQELKVLTRSKSSASSQRNVGQLANRVAPQTVIQEVEPNNTVAQAQVLAGASPLEVNGNAEVNDVGAVVINFGGGVQDDLEDLYLVTTTAQGLKINLDGFTSDCDIYLLNAGGTNILAQSFETGATTPEEINDPNLAAGTYLISVTIYDPDPIGGPTTAYKLTVTGQFGGGGVTLQAYNIYRSTSSPVLITPQNRIGNVNINTTTFNNTNVPGGTHFYAVTAVYTLGESGPSNEVSVQVVTLAKTAETASQLPVQFALSQNYPNPFNPQTSIKFALPKRAHVKIDVFNLLGEKVTELVNREMEAGYHQVQLDARGYTSGIYFYVLQAGDFKDLKKMIIAK
jgi:hypothetical protein